MSIHPTLKLEDIVQIDDKTRLDGRNSFVTTDEAAVTLVEIEVEAAAGFVDITPTPATDNTEYFYDFAYSGATRSVDVTLRITTDGAPTSTTSSIQINTATDDKLFSDDQNILPYEPELRRFYSEGKSSYLAYHRKVRDLILDWINEMGFTDTSRDKITADAFVDLDEVRKWSESWTLWLIFQDLSNSVDDKFAQKAAMYQSRTLESQNRTKLRLDLDGDGTIDKGEFLLMDSVRMVRD